MNNTIEMDLRSAAGGTITVYINVDNNSLSCKWTAALEHLVRNNYHLEKNYCWFGFAGGPRNVEYLCDQINRSIAEINRAGLGYHIDCEPYTVANTILPGEVEDGPENPGDVNHDKMNWLHRYFEDLQGVSGQMSPYYEKADAATRWHIRQLNLLCHEYESLVLSRRKAITAPDWRRPSTLMCWLHAPRFELEYEDYELFGVDTINRDLGGVYVGVNKAVGKHHWEVFNDEGRDSRIGELISTTLRSQTEAAGDFDIEWGRNPGEFDWQQRRLADFRHWLQTNGFNPEDKSLTIGHPKVAQVDLQRSFGTTDYNVIWDQLEKHLDVYKIRVNGYEATYTYNWSDPDYMQQQIAVIQQGK